ncbi:uncharacterized protein BCR38DRAFT_189501 [Pseudomassariella vexata]|uniref:Uncharacterized protein n=1 Tax=Pseudomassariella vexata TaxID=1141098 RepID=A0A1Y2E0F7_9PEZI|nr:uncharacterized protein BCR38DRAFT_189501 [Pseudomassariella vexata]ORY65022.1 hypothetical protein BCR38DRAFT_189501 [Pseudomassariella vexata]
MISCHGALKASHMLTMRLPIKFLPLQYSLNFSFRPRWWRSLMMVSWGPCYCRSVQAIVQIKLHLRTGAHNKQHHKQQADELTKCRFAKIPFSSLGAWGLSSSKCSAQAPLKRSGYIHMVSSKPKTKTAWSDAHVFDCSRFTYTPEREEEV